MVLFFFVKKKSKSVYDIFADHLDALIVIKAKTNRYPRKARGWCDAGSLRYPLLMTR